jgi:hypothetical protein
MDMTLSLFAIFQQNWETQPYPLYLIPILVSNCIFASAGLLRNPWLTSIAMVVMLLNFNVVLLRHAPSLLLLRLLLVTVEIAYLARQLTLMDGATFYFKTTARQSRPPGAHR